jgi:hypothetical protein
VQFAQELVEAGGAVRFAVESLAMVSAAAMPVSATVRTSLAVPAVLEALVVVQNWFPPALRIL